MDASVSIDRTSLSLSPLVISASSGTLRIAEDGLGRPSKSRANEYAQARFLHGAVLTSTRLDQSDLPLTVYLQAASTAALAALQDELEAAFGQFTYEVTVTIDGSSRTWRADPASVGWGQVDSGLAQAYMARASVTIPVFPVEV